MRVGRSSSPSDVNTTRITTTRGACITRSCLHDETLQTTRFKRSATSYFRPRTIRASKATGRPWNATHLWRRARGRYGEREKKFDSRQGKRVILFNNASSRNISLSPRFPIDVYARNPVPNRRPFFFSLLLTETKNVVLRGRRNNDQKYKLFNVPCLEGDDKLGENSSGFPQIIGKIACARRLICRTLRGVSNNVTI